MNKEASANQINVKLGLFIYILCIFIFLLFPTVGIPNYTVIMFFLCTLITIPMFIMGKIDWISSLIWFLIISLLLVFTMKLSMNASIDSLRYGVILQFFAFFMITVVIIPRFKHHQAYYNIFIILNILIVIWGLGIVFDFSLIINMTSDFFLWGNEGVTLNMLDAGKPVLSFGVHSVAAFFLCQMFFLNYITFKNPNVSRKVMHVIFMILLLALCIYLRSTTSLLFSVVMLLFLINISTKLFAKIFSIIIAAILTFLLIINTDLSQEYMAKLFDNGGGFGGITARYSSDLFSTHFNYIRENGFIGFSDIGFRYNTDSGFVLNYMRGGVLNVILIFIVMYRFFRNNYKRRYLLYIVSMMLIFDSITTMFMYPQIIAFSIFSIIYLKSVMD